MVKTRKRVNTPEKKLTGPKKATDDAIPTKESKEESEPEFKGSVSLGTSKARVIGRNKCGMPWKKSSKRSNFSKGPPVSYLKSMEEKERLKRIRERVANLREERKNSKQE